MPVSFRRFREICEKRKITSYTFRKNKLIGQAAWKNLQNDDTVTTATIGALCAFLGCQPGDLMEYIPDENKA